MLPCDIESLSVICISNGPVNNVHLHVFHAVFLQINFTVSVRYGSLGQRPLVQTRFDLIHTTFSGYQ
jgi:hypothetical protein